MSFPQFRRILLLPHPFRKEALQFAARTAAFLAENGLPAYAMPELAAQLQPDAAVLPYDGQALADLAVVIGGDGTVLRSIHALPNADFPFWAVNFGHVGYLTDCEPEQALDALRQILSGSYTTEKRMLLCGEIQDGSTVCEFHALNEAAVHRCAMSRALRIGLSVSGRFLQTFPADGVLVSTPTGSTAYNLSAGGPILMPESENIAVTPICSHLLGGRALVISGEDTVGIDISLPDADESRPPQEADCPRLVADGFQQFILHDGAHITLHRASRSLRLLRTRTDSFYQTLQKKLS